MKFITEDELRDRYRKEPFTSYDPEPNVKLTPGARQFLADRGINLFDDDPCVEKKPVIKESLTKEVCCTTANPAHNGGNIATVIGGAGKKCNWRTKMIRAKLRSAEALFLSTEQLLLDSDVLMAQNLTQLGKQFSDIRHMVEGKGTVADLPCKECTGMNCGNYSEDLDDCIEITDFHVQLEKGTEILALHKLRCCLREIEPVMMQAFEGNEAAVTLCNDAVGKINQIINAISQMICGAVGGKECQRKM